MYTIDAKQASWARSMTCGSSLWRSDVCCSLRGHEMDVLDLAWRRGDAFLASCSVDNSILVWNTAQHSVTVLSPFRILRGHLNWVKVWFVQV